jgi:hypothetical protein
MKKEDLKVVLIRRSIGMKRNRAGFFAAALAAFCMLASCAAAPRHAAPQPEPEWYRNREAVYPEERYIAYQGRGSTREEARQKALADLAAYFEQEVKKEGTASISMTERQGAGTTAVEKTRRIEETVTVTVSRNLRGVQYAEDDWRNPATGEFVTVAYMDREKAWGVYSPQAENAANTFVQLFYDARNNEADPFTRALRFGKAEAYVAGEEFATARGFAEGLYPARAKVLFEEADGVMQTLPKEANAARQNASIYLECPLDLGGLIRNAATAAFEEAGFFVTAERRGAAALCVIQVTEGLLRRPPGTGTFYLPKLEGKVKSTVGGEAVVFSFTAEAEVQSAIDGELARSRAYTALARALRNTLAERLAE